MAANASQTLPEIPPRTVGESLEDMLRELQADIMDESLTYQEKYRAIYRDEYIYVMSLLAEDPIAYDRTISEISRITGMKVTALKDHFKLNAPVIPKQEAPVIEETEFDKKVKSEAKGIIERGETYKFIYGTWQKKVKGNQLLGLALIISRGVQSCLNSKGLHIYAHGKPGQGKSHGMEVMIDLLPGDFVKDGNISPKVLYYMQVEGMILPGTTISIDDLNMGNELADLFKKMTTRFQSGAEHRVVIEGSVKELKMPSRLAIWTSSVDMQGDEQSRDRFLDIPINEKQTAEIIKFMQEADKSPQNDDERQFESAVCRDLFLDLATKTFHVEIPFADEFNFSTEERTRGYGIFSDLIKGLAALRYAKRATNSLGRLLADPEDFHEAKALYEGLMGHSEQKFGTAEQEVLQALIELRREADISALSKKTGKSETRLREILNGRSSGEQKRHGLLAKCGSSLTAEYETITEPLGGDSRKTYRRIVYKLDPGFELKDGKTSLITVKANSEHLNVAQRRSNVVVNVLSINSSS